MKSKSLHSEVLFCLAATKKIDEAVRQFGVREDSREIAVVTIARSEETAEYAIRGELTTANAFDEACRVDSERHSRVAEAFKIPSSLVGNFAALEKLVVSKIAVKTVL